MLRNLKAEMKRYGIRNQDIADLLKITEKAVRLKLDGKNPFKYPEAELLRDTFFSSLKIEYLMQKEI